MKLFNPIKFLLGLFAVILIRLIQMPLPNFEPIMGAMLPFAKKYGRLAGFIFASLALASFDLISGRLGMWTLYCALTYGLIGIAAGKYFGAEKRRRMKYYLGFGAIGTVFYDAATALVFGWQFGQPLEMTILGQIPFTIYHLMGSTAFILVLTPLVNNYIVENPMLELNLMGEPARNNYHYK
ncbi:MAG: hypothetical protein V1835_06695 [Candidatus Micrarchaeota archaeon]